MKRCTGEVAWAFQMKSLLSLPPEASWLSSNDHRRPHTSCLCPARRLTYGSRTRTSRRKMRRSRLPDAKTCAMPRGWEHGYDKVLIGLNLGVRWTSHLERAPEFLIKIPHVYDLMINEIKYLFRKIRMIRQTCAFQAMVPMRAEWPAMVRRRRHRLVSQICTSPCWFRNHHKHGHHQSLILHLTLLFHSPP